MKISKDLAKRSYELTFLLSAELETAAVAEAVDQIKKQLAKNKAKIVAEEEWGKKELAYAIKHAGKQQAEAFYYHWQLEMPTDQTQALHKALSLHPQVMRCLLVVSTPVADATV